LDLGRSRIRPAEFADVSLTRTVSGAQTGRAHAARCRALDPPDSSRGPGPPITPAAALRQSRRLPSSVRAVESDEAQKQHAPDPVPPMHRHASRRSRGEREASGLRYARNGAVSGIAPRRLLWTTGERADRRRADSCLAEQSSEEAGVASRSHRLPARTKRRRPRARDRVLRPYPSRGKTKSAVSQRRQCWGFRPRADLEVRRER
jgi:hypothetical protein